MAILHAHPETAAEDGIVDAAQADRPDGLMLRAEAAAEKVRRLDFEGRP